MSQPWPATVEKTQSQGRNGWSLGCCDVAFTEEERERMYFQGKPVSNWGPALDVGGSR